MSPFKRDRYRQIDKESQTETKRDADKDRHRDIQTQI